jgi:uncharacterized membrane protein YkgB
MDKRHQKYAATQVVMLLLVSILGMIQLPTTEAYGNETLTIDSGTATHYDFGDTVSFTMSAGNLDDTVNYELEWRVCLIGNSYYQSGDYSDWVDGDCSSQMAEVEIEDGNGNVDWYFNLISGIPTVSNTVSTASFSDTVPSTWTITDGNGNAVVDGQGNTVTVPTLSNGGQFIISAMLTVSGVTVATVASPLFSVGHRGSISSIDPATSGNILESMDYQFSIQSTNQFRYETVDSSIAWELVDDDNNQAVVASGTSSPSTNSDPSTSLSHTITGATLPASDYTLSAWVVVDGNPPPATVTYGQYTQQYFGSVSDSHSFTVASGTITGNEALTVDAGTATHYDFGDPVPFTLDIADMSTDPGTTYDLEWRVCLIGNSYYQSGDYSDWVDGDCSSQMAEVEIEDGNGNVDWYFNLISGIPTVSNTVSTASFSDTVPSTWTITDGNGNAVVDGQGNTVTVPTLSNGGQFIISAMLTVSGVTVATVASPLFSVGHRGSISSIDPATSGNILESMDYQFSIQSTNQFRYETVDSSIAWELVDDDNNQAVVASGTSSPSTNSDPSTSLSHTITGATLPASDYTLSAWVVVDGNPPPATVTYGQYTQQYFGSVSDSHSFSVIDPAFGTLASLTVSSAVTPGGWAEIDVSANQLNNGDLHNVEWRIYDSSAPALNLADDAESWISPPSSHSFSVNSNMITDGSLCFEADLYVGTNMVDSESTCWTQLVDAAHDHDGDGVFDINDQCPVDAATNDVDNDGCEDPVDSDGDGLPDWWEILTGLDPNSGVGDDGATGDPDNDGLSNLGEYMATSDPNNPDTDSDTVNDGDDLCVMIPGTGADGCPTGPVNLPPTCDVYYSIEADGLVVQGDAVIPGLVPGSTSGTIEVPEGSYYIIAVCSDPEGDDVVVTLNSDIIIGPTSSATVGILVQIAEDTDETFEIEIEWTDGVNILTATVTIELEEDNSGGGIPGFTLMLGIISMLGAALISRRRE